MFLGNGILFIGKSWKKIVRKTRSDRKWGKIENDRKGTNYLPLCVLITPNRSICTRKKLLNVLKVLK